jgi:hypothetical protein
MSGTRALREMAARLRPKLRRPALERPSTADLARVERRGKVQDPYLEMTRLAWVQPEVYGGVVMTMVDPSRPHGSDPQAGPLLDVPGAPKPGDGW